jgi:hypothetical protein
MYEQRQLYFFLSDFILLTLFLHAGSTWDLEGDTGWLCEGDWLILFFILVDGYPAFQFSQISSEFFS